MKEIKHWLFLSLAPFWLSAQSLHSVKGSISDADGNALSANVMAFDLKDSSLIKGDFFIDGVFELTDLKQQEIFVKLSSIEFDDRFLNVSFKEQRMVDLGMLEVSSSQIQIDEVVVSAKRPEIIQRANGTLEVLIENTTLSTSSTVNEVLSKSPDVLVDEDGNVSVFGKGDAIIYLNNKRILRSQLNLISPSNIKKIEIIRNPSAKYDAEGGAIINITTIKNQEDGYQIALNQNVNYSRFAGVNTTSGVNMNYKKGRLNTNANFSLSQGRDRHILHTTRNREAKSVFLQTDLTTDWQHHYKPFSNFGVGLQFEINQKSYTSLEYSGFAEKLGGNQISTNDIVDDQGEYFYKSDVFRNELEKNHTLSYNYNLQLDTLGSNLFIGGQYSDFRSGVNNSIFEDRKELENSLSRSLKNVTDLNVKIYSAQADLLKSLGNNTLETGLKFSTVENGSVVNFYETFSVSPDILDSNLSNSFGYSESIGAGYLNFIMKPSKTLDFRIGFRGEYTEYALNLSQVKDEIISGKYFNVFPNFSTNIRLTDLHSLSFSYAARIARVPYQRLNPVLYYQDPFTSIQGNPNSIPEKIHAFEIGSKLNKTSVKIGYNYIIDPFGGGALRGTDNKSYVLIRLNFDETHELYSSISRTFETKWLTSTNNLNIRYTNIIDNVFDFHHLPPKPNLYFYSNNRINVGDLFNTEVLFYYLGNNKEGIYNRYSSWNLALAADKTFLDGALTCRLVANDLFRSIRAAGDYNIGETAIFFHRHWNTNYIRASISYNFGGLTKNSYKKKSIGESERQRAR